MPADPPDLEAAFPLIDALRASASAGLRYTGDPLDRQRYEGLLELSGRLLAALEATPADDAPARMHDALGQITPMLSADAVVVRGGRMLLIRRSDTRLWALPGGLAESGELLARSAERELEEETGLVGSATRLLAAFDSRVWRSASKQHLVHCAFAVRADEGSPVATPEALEVGFFARHELPPPDSLHPGHRHWLPLLFEVEAGERPPHVDLPGERSRFAPSRDLM